MTNKTVLVFGSTGNMGGAVVRSLLKRNFTVRALVRDLESPKAMELSQLGANTIYGTYEDAESLVKAAEGCDFAFIVTPLSEMETEMGITAVKSMIKAKVPHIIFNSVSDSNNNTGIPHFETKRKVEVLLEASKSKFTIVGPVYVMDNLISPWLLADLKEGKLIQPLSEDVPLQMVSYLDIGEFVSTIMEDPHKFVNKRIDIAGDSITFSDVISILKSVSKKNITFVNPPLDDYPEDFQLMFSWFNNVGYSVDIEKLQSTYPEVAWTSFRRWADIAEISKLLS